MNSDSWNNNHGGKAECLCKQNEKKKIILLSFAFLWKTIGESSKGHVNECFFTFNNF